MNVRDRGHMENMEERRLQAKLAEQSQAEIAGMDCYKATLNKSNKYTCPKCNAVEGGERRIITHNYDCDYRGKEYCEKLKGVGGGRRRNKKTLRKNRRYSRRN